MSLADDSALLSARLREAWACVELDGLDRCEVVMRGSWSLRLGTNKQTNSLTLHGPWL